MMQSNPAAKLYLLSPVKLQDINCRNHIDESITANNCYQSDTAIRNIYHVAAMYGIQRNRILFLDRVNKQAHLNRCDYYQPDNKSFGSFHS